VPIARTTRGLRSNVEEDMRLRLAGLSFVMALATGGAAPAAVVVATFSGVVSEGVARGVFGFDYESPGNLAGYAITGTIQYNTSTLSACDYATSFFGCFYGPGLSMTQTINGVTEVFPGEPLPGSPAYNDVAGGVQLYNLIGHDAAFHTASSLGDPATVYRSRDAGVSVALPASALPSVGSPILTYDGPVSDGGLAIGTFTRNVTSLYEITGGFITQSAQYSFSVTQFTIGEAAAAPEPMAWLLMLLGFGAAGQGLRNRRRHAAVA
jgi:hypothetical protein